MSKFNERMTERIPRDEYGMPIMPRESADHTDPMGNPDIELPRNKSAGLDPDAMRELRRELRQSVRDSADDESLTSSTSSGLESIAELLPELGEAIKGLATAVLGDKAETVQESFLPREHSPDDLAGFANRLR